jgi:hypothetical protein
LNLKGREPDTPSRSAFLQLLSDRRKPQDEAVYLGSIMPVLRYFTFVGGALLALLIGVSFFVPEPETITRPDAARPVIRIASDRVVPPRVDIDTRVQIAIVPAPVPEILPQAPVREAEVRQAAPPSKAEAPVKIERKKTRIAKRPDRQRMAANPQGFQPFPQAFQSFPQAFQPFRLTW